MASTVSRAEPAGLAALLAAPRITRSRGRTAVAPVAPAPAPAAVDVPAPVLPWPRRKRRTPAEALESLARARESLARRERVAVRMARRDGLSWQDIADRLELSVSTVHGRYR